MPTEYEPIFPRRDERDESDLEAARQLFGAAARRFLAWPWGWFAWGIALPLAALLTPNVARRFGAPALLFLWSGAILAAGGVEAVGWLRSPELRSAPSGLARWAMRGQGNLSLVGVALSVLLLANRLAWALPAVWLLLLGHSLWSLGGLALPVWRRCGVLYQLAGCLALWPGPRSFPVPWPLAVFAAATALGNFWIGFAVWRLRRRRLDSGIAQAIPETPAGP